jgi:hypothetical protein
MAEPDPWLEAWAHRWCCMLRTGGCAVTDEEECETCSRWEPYGGLDRTDRPEQRREP